MHQWGQMELMEILILPDPHGAIGYLGLKEFLKNNDSARFFQKQKANIKTDFTHMNLMDIGIILK